MKMFRNWLAALFAPLVIMLGLTPAYADVMALPDATAAPPPTLTTTVDMDLGVRSMPAVLASYYLVNTVGAAPPLIAATAETNGAATNLNYTTDLAGTGHATLGGHDTADPVNAINSESLGISAVGTKFSALNLASGVA